LLAASVADIANRTRSTAVLEYGRTETPTLLGPMLLGFARLCRQPPPGRVRTMAENPGLSRNQREIRRETDCLLEGAGFELAVPRQTGSGFEASYEMGYSICDARF